jgi:hypothetical protein
MKLEEQRRACDLLWLEAVAAVERGEPDRAAKLLGQVSARVGASMMACSGIGTISRFFGR